MIIFKKEIKLYNIHIVVGNYFEKYGINAKILIINSNHTAFEENINS